MIHGIRPTDDTSTLVERAAVEPDPHAAMAILGTARVVLGANFVGDVLDAAVRHLRRDPRRSFWFARIAAHRATMESRGALAARAFRTAGGALLNLGRPRLALAHYDRALRALGSPADPVEVAAVEVKRIHPLGLLGRHDEARAAAETALAVREPRADALGIAEVEIALGDLCYRQDRFREALRHYTRSRNGLAPDRHARLRAILDCNSANCLEALHRWGAAQRLFDRARAAFEKDGLSQTVAQVDHNRAYFAFVRGRYAESLRLYDRAEATFDALGDASQVGQIALERAEVHLQMGMPRDAQAQAAVAADRFDRAGLAKERAQALVITAVAGLLDGGAHPGGGARTGDALLAARAIFAAQGYDVRVADCDLLRAAAAETRGDAATARALATSAQDTFLRVRLAPRAASADLVLARLDLAAGRPADALAAADRAEERIRGLASPWFEVELLRFRGLAQTASGDVESGAATLVRAVDAIERQRGAVPADEFMVAFLASRAALYAETFGALLAAGRDEAAFDVCERAKARALSDLLAARDGDLGTPRDLDGVRDGRRREELNAIYTRLHRHAAGIEPLAPDRLARLRDEVTRRESDLAIARRRRISPGATSSATDALTLDRIQSQLDSRTTLIEYFAAPDGLHAFVVRRHSFAHRRLDTDDDAVLLRVQRLRFHLAKFNLAPAAAADQLALRATRANLAALAAEILDPLRDLISTDRIVVVPHGALHDVPFHALPEGEGWLADAVDVAYAPSAAVYVRCGARQPTATGISTILALPDDAAPLIEREAYAVAWALGDDARCFLGADATASRLRDAARTSRVLHVATHGMFRADAPSMSSIRLADAWLNLYDIYELDVRGELVVLSACDTAAATVNADGDPMGLVRGFLVAGAPRVLASRWRVGDASAALFMEQFYGALGDGVGAEAALRCASAVVRARFPHPYHWAAFSLFGHPGGVAGRRREGSDGRRANAAAHLGRVTCVPRS